MKKFFVGVAVAAGLIAVLAVGFGWVMLSNADAIIVRLIEKEGSRITGTQVSVDSVFVDLQRGDGVIRGVRVENPEGFPAGDAMLLNEVSLRIDVDSLPGRVAVIEEVLIDAPRLSFVLDADGRTNFEAIDSRLAEASRASGAGQQPLVARVVRVRDGRVTVDSTAVGGDVEEIALGEFELRDVGAPDGAPPTEIGRAVLQGLTREVTRAVAREGVLDAIAERLPGRTGEAVRGVLESILD